MEYTVFMSNPAATFDADERVLDVLSNALREQTRLQMVNVVGGKRALVNIAEIVAVVPRPASRSALPETYAVSPTASSTAAPAHANGSGNGNGATTVTSVAAPIPSPSVITR